jgi:hypothetical protein
MVGSGIRKKPIPDPGGKKVPDPDPQHWFLFYNSDRQYQPMCGQLVAWVGWSGSRRPGSSQTQCTGQAASPQGSPDRAAGTGQQTEELDRGERSTARPPWRSPAASRVKSTRCPSTTSTRAVPSTTCCSRSVGWTGVRSSPAATWTPTGAASIKMSRT